MDRKKKESVKSTDIRSSSKGKERESPSEVGTRLTDRKMMAPPHIGNLGVSHKGEIYYLSPGKSRVVVVPGFLVGQLMGLGFKPVK